MKNKNKKVIERNLGNNSTEASTIVKIAIGVIIVFVLKYQFRFTNKVFHKIPGSENIHFHLSLG